MFYHLQDELIRTKSGDTEPCKNGYFSAQNARESLHNLRVSLNRSLILPHIEVDSEEEMDVDEEDVQELRDQIRKLHSSSEDTFDDFMDAESGDDTPCSKGNPKTSEEDDQPVIDDCEDPIQEEHEVLSSTKVDQDLVSDRKSFLSVSASPHQGCHQANLVYLIVPVMKCPEKVQFVLLYSQASLAQLIHWLQVSNGACTLWSTMNRTKAQENHLLAFHLIILH